MIIDTAEDMIKNDWSSSDRLKSEIFAKNNWAVVAGCSYGVFDLREKHFMHQS
jgi:hypothetical protein